MSKKRQFYRLGVRSLASDALSLLIQELVRTDLGQVTAMHPRFVIEFQGWEEHHIVILFDDNSLSINSLRVSVDDADYESIAEMEDILTDWASDGVKIS